MTRADLGFAIFLATLLLVPNVAVPGLTSATADASPAAAALLLWWVLASDLPVLWALRSKALVGLMLFGVYVFLASCLSGRVVAIVYATQWAVYAILAGALVPAYLLLKARQGRIDVAWRIVAWIAGIYAAGILVSLWTGPIYPSQLGGAITKHYGDIDLPRGAGFSEGVNAAGGIMAILTVFVMLVYRPSGRYPALLVLLCLAGLVSTMSRGAIASFAVAMAVSALVWGARATCSTVPHPRVSLRLAAAWGVAVIALVVTMHQPMTAAAWQRLWLNQDYVSSDVGDRVGAWTGGLEHWVDGGPFGQMLGEGFRSNKVSTTGAFDSSHNGYVEMLRDFGMIGVLLFGTLLAAIARSAMRLAWRGETFALVALLTMIFHNMTQVYWYSPVLVVFLAFVLGTMNLLRAHVPTRVPEKEPEAPMPGIWLQLTPEQREHVLDYNQPTVKRRAFA